MCCWGWDKADEDEDDKMDFRAAETRDSRAEAV